MILTAAEEKKNVYLKGKMGGTRFTSKQSSPILSNSPESIPEPPSVNPQKNSFYSRYPRNVSSYESSFRQQHYAAGSTEKNGSNFFLIKKHQNCIRVHDKVPASQKQMQPGSLPVPLLHNGGSSLNDQNGSSSEPNLSFAAVNNPFGYGKTYNQPFYHTDQNEMYSHPSHTSLPTDRPLLLHAVHTPWIYPTSHYNLGCNTSTRAPFMMIPRGCFNTGYNSREKMFSFDHACEVHNSQSNAFQLVHIGESCCHVVPSSVTYQQTLYKHDQDNSGHGKQSWVTQQPSSPGLFRSDVLLPTTPKSLTDYKTGRIQETAQNFVQSCLPLLTKKPYCVPPIKRSQHPDRGSKRLVQGMESEKRVLGSFERFFAEQQLPVFMLCHYPMSGFMQVYNSGRDYPDRDSEILNGKSDRNTVTILLLSHVFAVTVVTINTGSGSSDFPYLQRSVHKTAMRGKRCCTTVTQWLTFLGVTPKVRQVIAFPNVKKAIVHRITNEKSFQLEFGSLCTLHVDELSPPFEEEWSTPEQKHIFSEWMKKQITCHSPTLSGEDVHLVVGALLSPRLSYVDFVDESTIIAPISESMKYSDEVEKTVQDVKHLKLTISGVTKPFDEFMDEYVSCYYPKLEEKTYRVPPIHFNIQSFKKPKEYIQNMEGNSLPTKSSSDLREVNCGTASESTLGFLKEGVDNESENNIQRGEPSNISQFMPPYRPYHMSAKRSSNCSDNAGPLERQTPKSESSQATVPQAMVSSLDTTHSENSQRRNRSSGKSHDSQSTQYNSHHQHTAVPAEFNSRSRFIGSEASAQSAPTVSTLRSQSLPSASVKGGKMSAEIPPEMRSSKNICLEALQDVEVLCEVMAKDTRADEGENRVICALESLGEKFGPMFIICGYQYNNYLNKLKEEMFSKGDASRPVRAFGQTMRAEHDCLIFHKKYGAIIVCIKAIGDNFTEWGASEEQKINSTNRILEKAVKQLEREETMLKHVTSDLDPKLACHKLIALPNMTRERVEKALETEDRLLQKVKSVLGHGSELFLCSDELPSKYEAVWDHQDQSLKEKLISWWEKVDKFFSSNEEGLTSRTYRQVIGRYCGLLSTVEVWSTASPRIEVRSASEAVNVCFERFRKFVLLPHQVQALCLDDRRMFLYGPPGSGKTLVLILKAKEWLLAGETVILINSRPGSVYGFPYAYGVYKRLQRMMHEWNIQLGKLAMLTVDCLRFKADDLAGVMPSSCIIMDEVTPASHEVIEHLCSLQVSNIWCAGLFEDDRPITAHSFTAFKMHKILRCPPVVQSVLKHTESQVRMATPYKEDYQVSMFEKKHLNIKRYRSSPSDGGLCSDKEIKKDELMKQDFSSRKSPLEDNSSKCSSGKSPLEDNSSKCSSGNAEIKKLCMMEVNGNENIHKENEISQEVLKYDPESLNKRLQERYNNKENENEKSPREGVGDSSFIYSTSSSEIGLPTDGPRPHIIDHSRHSQAGSPNDCSECGSSLAEFLKSMVRSEDVPASSGRSKQQDQSKSASKNTVSASGRGRSGKTAESVLFSVTSSVHTKSSPFISRQKPSSLTDGKALSWSDVLIVGREFPKDSAFIAALRSRHIPVEVLMDGRTSEIEDTEDNKLFITSYKEVTGLERALIVFVPSDSPNLQDSANTVNINDLQLGHCINHFIEEDKRALWYVASRSLASLVLILS